jgi:hypothetical protein
LASASAGGMFPMGVCAVPAPWGFRLRVGFPVRAAGFFAFVSAQNELTGDSRMSSF